MCFGEHNSELRFEIMEALKRQRATVKGQVTRIVTFCESIPAPVGEAKVRQTRLEQHMKDFECIQNEIEGLIEDSGELSEETQYRKDFQDPFYTVHAKLMNIIQREKLADW